MTDNKDGTHTLTNKELEDLFTSAENFKKENETTENDILILYRTVMKTLESLNLVVPHEQFKDILVLRPEIVRKEKNPIKYLIKGGTNYLMLLTQAKFSAEAEKELTEKYSFVDDATPIILKISEKILNNRTKKNLLPSNKETKNLPA